MNYKIKRKRILDLLENRSRNIGGMLIVSITRRQISRRLKISGSSIYRAINYLQWKGDLRIYKKKGYVNYYRITTNKNIIS